MSYIYVMLSVLVHSTQKQIAPGNTTVLVEIGPEKSYPHRGNCMCLTLWTHWSWNGEKSVWYLVRTGELKDWVLLQCILDKVTGSVQEGNGLEDNGDVGNLQIELEKGLGAKVGHTAPCLHLVKCS
jgi:hypothetical protein